jgi:glycosyltransferase involved in cell wall biosynthesis
MRDTDGNQDPIRVQHYQRKPTATLFSLERVFAAVRMALPADITAETHSCPFQSRHVLRRILNIIDAPFHQRDINHIVGDVHYLALGLKKRKTILTIHDCVGLRFSKGFRRVVLLWFWHRLPARRVAAITVISEFTRDEVLNYTGCDARIVHVISCPVPSGFVAWPKEFRAERPVILQVGTAPHNKNICRVAEALRGIPCRLDIIGRVTERQREVLEFNRIQYTERWNLSDEEVIEKYRECDMVVFASIYEGFGMPIIEANATGRPVVTSNIGPMPGVAGSAACLVNPFDSSSIREGIVSVIEDADYRSCLVAQGYENAKRFQAEVIAAQYADLYREVFLQR